MMGWQWHQLNHMQAICTSLQKITTPAPHQSDFYGPDALPDTQPTASKHWRPDTTTTTIYDKLASNTARVFNGLSYQKVEATNYDIMTYWLTALVSQVMQSPTCISIRLSICFHSILWTNWPLTLNLCMWVGNDHSLQGNEGHRSRLRWSWVRLMWPVWRRSREIIL